MISPSVAKLHVGERRRLFPWRLRSLNGHRYTTPPNGRPPRMRDAAWSRLRSERGHVARRLATAQSLEKPSALHSSEPTPLCTMNNPVGSYFFFTKASCA